jgi:hypothetical protein
MPQGEYINLKKSLVKLYPDLRKFFETLEIKLGNGGKGEFTFS